MSQRRAVTKTIATRYVRADRASKKSVLDELVAVTGWHRDHARKALRLALVLKPLRARPPRPPLYGEPVIEALRLCWAVQGTPCGRLLAAALPDLVPRLRRFEELRIDDQTAATIDRRLAGDRANLTVHGRSYTIPCAHLGRRQIRWRTAGRTSRTYLRPAKPEHRAEASRSSISGLAGSSPAFTRKWAGQPVTTTTND